MKFIKVDPITGATVATGGCPDDEPLPPVDHEGLLVFPIEGEPSEYQFDHASMSLVRAQLDPVVELRRRLAAEMRAPTAEELAELASLSSVAEAPTASRE